MQFYDLNTEIRSDENSVRKNGLDAQEKILTLGIKKMQENSNADISAIGTWILMKLRLCTPGLQENRGDYVLNFAYRPE